MPAPRSNGLLLLALAFSGAWAGMWLGAITHIGWILSAVVLISVLMWLEDNWIAVCDRMGWGSGTGDDAGLGLGVEE